MATQESTEVIGVCISEIEDGFIEDKEIIPFVRDNVKAMIKAGSTE